MLKIMPGTAGGSTEPRGSSLVGLESASLAGTA